MKKYIMILFVVFLISTISVAEDYSIEGEWYSIYFDNKKLRKISVYSDRIFPAE